MGDNFKVRWFRITDLTWATRTPKRGLTPTITLDEGQPLGHYTLSVLPGPVVSYHTTLHLAKDAFRLMLWDLPA